MKAKLLYAIHNCIAIDGDVNSFSEDDTQAHFIGGLRFGDSNSWEGKIFMSIIPHNVMYYTSITFG